MIDIDLPAELVAALDGRTESVVDWLHQHGVADSTMHEWPGPVGVSLIEVSTKSGTYQPTEHGEPAIVHPVHDDGPYSDIIDVVAWRPSEPARWWLRTGAAIMLGEHAVRHAYVYERPLSIHRTPLRWLAAYGNGAVILDWRACRPELMEMVGFQAEDFDHGIEIQRTLRWPVPTLPPIRVPRDRELV